MSGQLDDFTRHWSGARKREIHRGLKVVAQKIPSIICVVALIIHFIPILVPMSIVHIVAGDYIICRSMTDISIQYCSRELVSDLSIRSLLAPAQAPEPLLQTLTHFPSSRMAPSHIIFKVNISHSVAGWLAGSKLCLVATHTSLTRGSWSVFGSLHFVCRVSIRHDACGNTLVVVFQSLFD